MISSIHQNPGSGCTSFQSNHMPGSTAGEDPQMRGIFDTLEQIQQQLALVPSSELIRPVHYSRYQHAPLTPG